MSASSEPTLVKPLALLVDAHARWLDAQTGAFRRALALPRVLGAAAATQVGTTPADVVFRTGTLRLLRYRRQTPAVHARPVLFCYALVNRPYILDLLPDKSVVRRYLDQGFEVYLIDWGVPSHADRNLRLADYVCKLLGAVVDRVRGEHGERVHLLGYCMGGTLATLFTALHPEAVASLTLLATPLDFSTPDSILNLWADARYFDVDTFVDASGNCPAGALQLAFLLTKPVQNLLEKYLTFYEQLEDPSFLQSYFAVERWVNDNIPVAGETFREFVKELYQENKLVRGTFRLGARGVDLARIDCPLLLLTAEQDHLVAPSSTLSLVRHVRSRHVHALSLDAGHVGLVISSKAHRTLWPEATRWLAACPTSS